MYGTNTITQRKTSNTIAIFIDNYEREAYVHKTSLSLPRFIEVPVPIQESG
jgi:hypothetical protein